jgi:hypothetical protein
LEDSMLTFAATYMAATPAAAPTLAAISGASWFFFIISEVITLLFVLALQKTLEKCSPTSKAMDGGMLWLLLIPLVNMVVNFIVVGNMAKSLANEFRARGIQSTEAEPGKSVGMAWSICGAGLIVLAFIAPGLEGIGGIVYCVLFGFYWKKMNDFGRMLDAAPAAAYPGYPAAGYPAAGYAAGPPPPGAVPAGYQAASYPAAAYPANNYPPPGAVPAAYPAQAYPQPGYQPPAYSAPVYPAQAYPSAAPPNAEARPAAPPTPGPNSGPQS